MEEEGQGELSFGFEPLWGGRTREARRRQRRRRAALAKSQAAWRSGKAPARGIRAVEERQEDTWAREKLEVEGGGQERRTAPAAGAPEGQSRGAEAQGGRRGKNGAEDHFAKPKKHRDFTVKSL
jgi:hypothetical protein